MARVKDRNSFKCTLLYRLGEPLINLIVQKKGTIENAVYSRVDCGNSIASTLPTLTAGPCNTCHSPDASNPITEIVATTINQLDIVVDDALDYFKANASSLGTEKDIMLLQLQQGIVSYKLCDDILSVNQPMAAGSISNAGLGFQFDAEETNAAVGLFSWQSQFGSRGIYGHLGGGTYDNLLTTEIALEYVSLVEMRYQVKFETNFNTLRKVINIYPTPKAVDHGRIIAFEVERMVGDDVCFQNLWLQEYATALLCRQVSANMSKYDGFQLVGGGVLNSMYYDNRAREDLERLREEMRLGSGSIAITPASGVFLTG